MGIGRERTLYRRYQTLGRLFLASSLQLSSQVKSVWETTLALYLEHLRLGAIDVLAARFRVPFVLLFLNRDDEACGFMRYWMQLDTSIDPDVVYDIHVGTKKGDWIYPREPDCRYTDINLLEIATIENERISAPFLVALAIVKLRIVAAHDATCKSIELAFSEKGTAGQRIHQVQSIVKDMLIRADVDVESQRQQTNYLLDAIHRSNPSMLPAILNPGPIADQPCPEAIIPGQPSQVYVSLKDYRRLFIRVPGALKMLKERFGSFPIYNWNSSRRHISFPS